VLDGIGAAYIIEHVLFTYLLDRRFPYITALRSFKVGQVSFDS
jgi:hypothetical protein